MTKKATAAQVAGFRNPATIRYLLKFIFMTPHIGFQMSKCLHLFFGQSIAIELDHIGRAGISLQIGWFSVSYQT